MSDDLPSAADVTAWLVDALASEGDQGLWEVVWWLNSDSLPSSAEKVALARQVVFALLREGLVTLRTAPWPKSADEGRALTDDEVALLADTDTPWFDPENVGESSSGSGCLERQICRSAHVILRIGRWRVALLSVETRLQHGGRDRAELCPSSIVLEINAR